jgi:hypothetical protein
MATYRFTCSSCEFTDQVRVAMESRNEVRPCPECEEATFAYDFVLTMKHSQVHLQEDIVSYMDRKFAQNKEYQGAPTWNKAVAGKTSGTAGAGRHFMGDPKHNKKWV